GVLHWEIPGTGVSGQMDLMASSQPLIRLPEAIRFVAPEVGRASFYVLKLALLIHGKAAAVNEVELTISPREVVNLSVCPYRLCDATQMALREQGLTLNHHMPSADIVITST